MADGLTEYHFNQSGYVAATGWPLYTILYVCGPSGKCLWLEVRDRGLLEPFVHLDISEVSAMTLSGLDYPSSIRELWIKEVWEP